MKSDRTESKRCEHNRDEDIPISNTRRVWHRTYLVFGSSLLLNFHFGHQGPRRQSNSIPTLVANLNIAQLESSCGRTREPKCWASRNLGDPVMSAKTMTRRADRVLGNHPMMRLCNKDGYKVTYPTGHACLYLSCPRHPIEFGSWLQGHLGSPTGQVCVYT